MYTFSSKLKIVAIVLIILGALGVTSGFMSSHKSLEEVKTEAREFMTGLVGSGAALGFFASP